MKKVRVGLDLLVVYLKQIWNGVGGGVNASSVYKLRQVHFLNKPYF